MGKHQCPVKLSSQNVDFKRGDIGKKWVKIRKEQKSRRGGGVCFLLKSTVKPKGAQGIKGPYSGVMTACKMRGETAQAQGGRGNARCDLSDKSSGNKPKRIWVSIGEYQVKTQTVEVVLIVCLNDYSQRELTTLG